MSQIREVGVIFERGKLHIWACIVIFYKVILIFGKRIHGVVQTKEYSYSAVKNDMIPFLYCCILLRNK